MVLFRFFHETVNSGSTILLGSLGVVGLCLTWWLGRGEWGVITTSAPHVMLVWSATIVFFGGAYGMFVNTGPSTNVYSHLSGFVAGVAIPVLRSTLLSRYQNDARSSG